MATLPLVDQDDEEEWLQIRLRHGEEQSSVAIQNIVFIYNGHGFVTKLNGLAIYSHLTWIIYVKEGIVYGLREGFEGMDLIFDLGFKSSPEFLYRVQVWAVGR